MGRRPRPPPGNAQVIPNSAGPICFRPISVSLGPKFEPGGTTADERAAAVLRDGPETFSADGARELSYRASALAGASSRSINEPALPAVSVSMQNAALRAALTDSSGARRAIRATRALRSYSRCTERRLVGERSTNRCSGSGASIR